MWIGSSDCCRSHQFEYVTASGIEKRHVTEKQCGNQANVEDHEALLFVAKSRKSFRAE